MTTVTLVVIAYVAGALIGAAAWAAIKALYAKEAPKL